MKPVGEDRDSTLVEHHDDHDDHEDHEDRGASHLLRVVLVSSDRNWGEGDTFLARITETASTLLVHQLKKFYLPYFCQSHTTYNLVVSSSSCEHNSVLINRKKRPVLIISTKGALRLNTTNDNQAGFSRSVFMVFHGSWLVFNSSMLMAFDGFRSVFHVSRSAIMVFHGSRLVFMVPGRFS